MNLFHRAKPAGRYGWRPQLPDVRDHSLTVVHEDPLPSKVDLRPQCPPVVDQGQLGSCTANAIAGALGFDQIAQGLPVVPLSRLFIYYGERVMEHTVRQDAGAMIRDGIKVVAKSGAPAESTWPYDISRFTRRPSARAYLEAKAHRAVEYASPAQTFDAMRGTLASGRPIVIGFTVYESFESASVAATGLVPMPGWREQVLGGHAVLIVGYDDMAGRWIVRNSWGTGWGDGGYFHMPYAYFTDAGLSSDLWVVRTIST